ncbi:MAG TPA: hypothetical protein VLS93_07455 [Anaeromyxobacteraceae bacterium]|nr:hypothetical protein [Anaeromyxobacteraceae bacterium]
MPPRALSLALLVALLPAPARSQPGGAPASPPAPGTALEEVLGTVRAVDRQAHRVRVETASGMVELSLDRNTLVYLPGGLGTVRDVVPGAYVRAGRNDAFVAYWVQVRPASRP